MNRPYIICHMVTSVDGKVTGEFLSKKHCENATEVYYEYNRNYKADAFACGRITMEGSFTEGWYPDLEKYSNVKVERKDYIADKTASYFAVAFDRRGRLGWKKSRIEDQDPGYDNAHIIEVLCENVQDEYLAYLKEIGVSYIFAGNTELDLLLVLEKLYSIFGIKKLMLEGGSIINGAFQRENVIDELSLVVAPISGEKDDKTLFDAGVIHDFTLEKVQKHKDSVWLNYKAKI